MKTEGIHSVLKRRVRLPWVGIGLMLGLLLLRIATDRWLSLSLPTAIQDFITLSASIIIEALPFVILGIVLSIFVQLWVPQSVFFRLIPKHRIPRRMVLSCLGFLLPVCECGNVPLARGLMVRGLSLGDSLTFLLAAPIINPVTIITTHQAFGGDSTILIARILGGLLIANIVGWLFDCYKNSDDMLTPEFAATCKMDHDSASGKDTKIRRSLNLFKSEANIIVPALLVGSFVAGLVQVAVPREILTSLGGSVVLSILAMMLLAFIVSICASVDAFFALAFANTFTAGSIVTFLVFGPIVDIKMLNLMRTTYRKQVLVTVTAVTILVSGTLGLVVNYAF